MSSIWRTGPPPWLLSAELVFFFVPATAPMTRAIKARLKSLGRRDKVGYLGELMQENYSEARRHGTLRYRPEHLKLLRGVRENPDVVDVAFEVLSEELAAKGIDMPSTYGERLPYDPDYRRIGVLAVVLAAVMTLLITASVLWVTDVALMSVLIVIVSVVGAILFIWGLTRLVIPVVPSGL